MKELRGIIFDFNGVLLWDSHLHEEAWHEVAKKMRGKEFSEEEIEYLIHGRTNGDILQYLADKPLSPEELSHYIDLKEGIYHQLCLKEKDEFKLAPNAITFLDKLKALHKLMTIATSSGIKNLDFYYKHLALAKWFDVDVVAYDDGTMKGKPEPDLYLKAAENLGLRPEECIVIEDARSGIAAAHRAGIGKIIAIGPKQKHQALAAIKEVNQTIAGFDELLNNWDDIWRMRPIDR